MSQIWIIRHAESKSNAGEKTTNPAKIDLTEKGYKQAACIVNAFKNRPNLIVTSPYLRTKQTAEPLVKRFSDVEQQEWLVHEFTYLSPEKCKDTTTQERRPLVAEYWERCDPFFNDGDGAESFADLMNRIEYFIEKVKLSDNEFTAVFSHGLFIRALIWRFIVGKPNELPHGMKRFRSFMASLEISNATMIKLQVEKDGSIWMSSVENGYIPLELLT